MVENVKLQVSLRENAGKGAARALRREGMVPAIIYGSGQEELKISIGFKELYKEFMTGNFKARVVELDCGKEKIKVLPCDVQLHPVTDVPLHADFLRVSDDSQVKVYVRVKFLNVDKAPGLKRGGVLSVIRREVELICRADSIPEVLELDLEGMAIGDSVHSHSINYPEGVSPAIRDRDFTIATIVGRAAEVVDDESDADVEDDAEELEEAAEGAEKPAEPSEGAGSDAS